VAGVEAADIFRTLAGRGRECHRLASGSQPADGSVNGTERGQKKHKAWFSLII